MAGKGSSSTVLAMTTRVRDTWRRLRKCAGASVLKSGPTGDPRLSISWHFPQPPMRTASKNRVQPFSAAGGRSAPAGFGDAAPPPAGPGNDRTYWVTASISSDLNCCEKPGIPVAGFPFRITPNKFPATKSAAGKLGSAARASLSAVAIGPGAGGAEDLGSTLHQRALRMEQDGGSQDPGQADHGRASGKANTISAESKRGVGVSGQTPL